MAVGAIGAAVVLAIYGTLLRKRTALRIEASNLKMVHCHGPVVKIGIQRPISHGLRVIEFLVHPNQCANLFRDFEHVYPGQIPSVY